jgi:hypothetical protein
LISWQLGNLLESMPRVVGIMWTFRQKDMLNHAPVYQLHLSHYEIQFNEMYYSGIHTMVKFNFGLYLSTMRYA